MTLEFSFFILLVSIKFIWKTIRKRGNQTVSSAATPIVSETLKSSELIDIPYSLAIRWCSYLEAVNPVTKY
jgi:hypothetical protein